MFWTFHYIPVCSLKCTTGVFPKIYFLPKIHKPNSPLRPIVSFVGTPLYKLTKYLAEILKHAYTVDEFHVKNSFEFVESMQNVILPGNEYILVSLDVKSLFTNIPTDLVLELISLKWNIISQHTKLTLVNFVTLFKFCVDNNYFKNEDHFYKQIFGLGMGNCLSPICSDIVMQHLQNTCLDMLSFKPPFFKRYVDDIATSIPETKIDELLSVFNSFHPRLQFTIELENEGKLPFLDVLLIRKENSILTNWYHKPTFSERYLNFHSNHPLKQKLNIIENLKHRAMALSNECFWKENLEKIKILLSKNSYPTRIINKILFKQPNSQSNNAVVTTSDKSPFYAKLPYVEGLSEKIRKVIQNDQVNIAMKCQNTVKKFFTSTKAKTPRDLESHTVYKIPCKNCDKFYIGQTGRYLRTRLKEHERDVRNSQNPLRQKTNVTALAEHAFDHNHSFNFTDTKMIGKEINLTKRLLREMVEIKKERKSINKRSDIENLSSAYYNIIDRIKT